ncbi:MAG: hypothetical protein ABEJ65_02565, partial [bacterium]
FPGILNTLRLRNQTYSIDYDNEGNREKFMEGIKSADTALRHLLLLRRYALKEDKQIRIVSWDKSYLPSSIYCLFCHWFGDESNMEFIQAASGYMVYFGEDAADHLLTMNLTRSNVLNQLAITPHQFGQYSKEARENDVRFPDMKSEVDQVMKQEILPKGRIPEDHSFHPDERENVRQQIERYEENDRRVFVLFAHLFYDVGIIDSGNAFDGMCDWIRETIDIFRDKKDLLLLKPHPSELHKHRKDPNETLAGFAGSMELPDNIVLLKPWTFRSVELFASMDCGLIWRSSVGLELTYMGVPSIISGRAPYRHALNLPYVSRREEYESLIESSDTLEVTPRLRQKVIQYLYYLKNYKHRPFHCVEHVEPNEGEFRWRKEEVRDLLGRDEDPVITSFMRALTS